MIVIDNEPMATILKERLEVDMPDDDVVLANINYIASDSCLRSHRAGLVHAALHVGTGRLVILTSVEPEKTLLRDPGFALLISKPNVKFLQQPVMLEDYRAAYQALKSQ